MTDPDIRVKLVTPPQMRVAMAAGVPIPGPPGPEGPVGPAGPQGEPGPPGLSNSVYSAEWGWSTQTGAPNSKQARSDSGDWPGATVLYLSDIDDTGTDRSAELRGIRQGDGLRAAQKNNSSIWATWDVVGAPVDQGTYFQVPVTPVDSSGTTPGNNTAVILNVMKYGLTAAQWHTGPGSPAPDLGRPGDMYLEGNGDVWQNVDPGGWTLTGTNIRGPAGP